MTVSIVKPTLGATSGWGTVLNTALDAIVAEVNSAAGTFVPLSAAGQQQVETQRTSALLPWFTALANRDSAPASVLTITDSIGEGRGASVYSKRWLDRTASLLRSRFPTAGLSTSGENYFPMQFISPLPQVWTIGGSPVVNNGYGLGLRGYQLSASGQQFSGTVTGTSMDLLLARGSSTGVLTVTVDGTPTTVTTSNGGATAPGQRMNVSLGSSGSHTVTIAWTSGGQVFLSGVIVYNGDESKGIRFYDGGHSGLWTKDYLGTGNITLAGGGTWFAADLAAVSPNLVLIELGINDADGGVSSATVKTNLTSLISFVRSSVPTNPAIVLVGLYDPGTVTSGEPWSNYVAAMQAIAAADTGGFGGKSGITVFDLTQRFPARLPTDTFSLFADTIHPNDKGHALIADSLAAFISPR